MPARKQARDHAVLPGSGSGACQGRPSNGSSWCETSVLSWFSYVNLYIKKAKVEADHKAKREKEVKERKESMLAAYEAGLPDTLGIEV